MKVYKGRNTDLIRFPLGGIGSGMFCITGTGNYTSFSLRNKPDLNHEPLFFAAVTVLGEENLSRVVEAPVPMYKIYKSQFNDATFGLPRFPKWEFQSQFPLAKISLSDSSFPLSAQIMGWSPFIPNDSYNSSLPFVGVEYTFTNNTEEAIEAVFYFNSSNFMKLNDKSRIRPIKNGFVLEQLETEGKKHYPGGFCISTPENAYVDAAWFRGEHFDTKTMLWNNIEKGLYANKEHSDLKHGQSDGATLAVPFKLSPGEGKTIKLRMSWYVPQSDIRLGNYFDQPCTIENCTCEKHDPNIERYKPWYSSVLNSIDDANQKWSQDYDSLFENTKQFTDCFYDTTLPEEIIEAVAANLSILKSPTILRQTDGRLWAWEGCGETQGSCEGSCSHVWNYAQAIPNLFPELERTFRQSEFNEGQIDETGHQEFRIYLPIRKAIKNYHAASDGQLGNIIKVYRDWRISGDTLWLRGLWDRLIQSINYCINLWDPDREGIIKEPHHNTYDIEFWGPDGMCSSFYLGALKATYEMGLALGYEYPEYLELYNKGRKYLEEKLFNGEYFYQKVMWKNLKHKINLDCLNDENRKLIQNEGPKYQYGTGCLSDGVLGVWLSELSGLTDIIDEEMLRSNLLSIYKYNFKSDLSTHANSQRASYALADEAGLILCSWPKGDKPSIPFIYSDEVWTGIEYQVASHLISKGFLNEGLGIVRACRSRYDGVYRNPYAEFESGYWYARALSSYALLQAFTGLRYDKISKTLYYSTLNSSNYRAFLSTATGFGTVDVKDGKINVQVISGEIEIRDIVMLHNS